VGRIVGGTFVVKTRQSSSRFKGTCSVCGQLKTGGYGWYAYPGCNRCSNEKSISSGNKCSSSCAYQYGQSLRGIGDKCLATITCTTCKGNKTVTVTPNCGNCSGTGKVQTPTNCSHGRGPNSSHYYCSNHGNNVNQYH